ncbi:MAG: DNA repair protein RecN [Pseudomonadota bacterium]
MLHHLSIRNLAIVDAVDLDLAPGMTAITGETGAGKSLLVDALDLLLGGRADSAVVRAGAEEATVSGVFSIGQGPQSTRVWELLGRLGIARADGEQGEEREILVRRTVAAGGRSRAFVDDVPVTLASLREIMHGVVDIMSQHEHQSLSTHEAQRELLDAFGEHGELRQRVAEAHATLHQLLDEQRALTMDEQQKSARIDYLQYVVDELQQASPEAGEQARLTEVHKRLGAVDRLRRHSATAETLLGSDPRAAATLIDEARRELRQVAGLSQELEDTQRVLDEASTLVQDAVRSLGRYVERLDEDPEQLAQVEDRLDLLRRLAKKHGVVPDALPGHLEILVQELDGLTHAQTRLESLAHRVRQAHQALHVEADALSHARRQAATRLSTRCAEELAALAMTQVRVEVQVEDLPRRDDEATPQEAGGGPRQVAQHGGDRIELRLGANPGEPARPLHKVASGGELSRVALAIRRVLADRDPVPTYVFDEVDAAIGGATAEAVGLALKQVSATHQVLCVTHLPQVAALADQQLQVDKERDGDRTVTVVRALAASERVDELARMLGGSEVGETARKHARSLLRRARA